MLADLTETIAEIIYLSEMERQKMDDYAWDIEAENIQEVYLQIAEEIIDVVSDNIDEDDIEPLFDEEGWPV
jgi:hypothetical protein